MKKFFALDPGDRWIGIAASDALGLIARPYKVIAITELESSIEEILNKEKVQAIIVGYPVTLRGTVSEQTKKAIALKELLENRFVSTEWILWDERFSSTRAENLKKPRTKTERRYAHSVAAALILQSYLDYRTQKK